MVDINELFNDFNALMQEKLGKNTSKMSKDERLAIANMLKAQSDDVTGVLKQKDSIRDVVPMDEDNLFEVRNGDCIQLIQEIPDNSIDLIFTDLPYGITDESWDVPINLDFLLKEFKRIIKPKGNILLTTSGIFTAQVVTASYNNRMYKALYPWLKNNSSGGLGARYMPTKWTEDIIHLSKKGLGVGTTFNQIFLEDVEKPRVRLQRPSTLYGGGDSDKQYVNTNDKKNYVRSYFTYKKVSNPYIHPKTGVKNTTQKPLDLARDLIEIFSNPGDLVLDVTAGSGSIGVASILSDRRFLGFELNYEFFEIINARLMTLATFIANGDEIDVDEDHYFWKYL